MKKIIITLFVFNILCNYLAFSQSYKEDFVIQESSDLFQSSIYPANYENFSNVTNGTKIYEGGPELIIVKEYQDHYVGKVKSRKHIGFSFYSRDTKKKIYFNKLDQTAYGYILKNSAAPRESIKFMVDEKKQLYAIVCDMVLDKKRYIYAFYLGEKPLKSNAQFLCTTLNEISDKNEKTELTKQYIRCKDLIKQKNYKDAFSFWVDLYEHCPKGNNKIDVFHWGISIYHDKYKNASNLEEKNRIFEKMESLTAHISHCFPSYTKYYQDFLTTVKDGKEGQKETLCQCKLTYLYANESSFRPPIFIKFKKENYPIDGSFLIDRENDFYVFENEDHFKFSGLVFVEIFTRHAGNEKLMGRISLNCNNKLKGEQKVNFSDKNYDKNGRLDSKSSSYDFYFEPIDCNE